MSRNSTLPIPRTHRYVQTEGMLCRYFTHGGEESGMDLSLLYTSCMDSAPKGWKVAIVA